MNHVVLCSREKSGVVYPCTPVETVLQDKRWIFKVAALHMTDESAKAYCEITVDTHEPIDLAAGWCCSITKTKTLLDQVSCKLFFHRRAGAVNIEGFNAEREKLLLSLGNDAWNKLDPISQSFLTTAKVTYNSYLAMRDTIDYSGVCLLVTKAVELEMSNRFCRDFIEFMRRKYPGKSSYPVYPTALLNRFGKPIRTKDFTLGSVAYVLC